MVFCTFCRLLRSGLCPNSMRDRYVRLPDTTNDKFAPFTFMQYSGYLHLMSCACISLLPKPHSMPKTYMRLSPSSSLPSGYLLTYKHMCGVVAPDICPNCTLYPVVTTPLPETLKLLSTFLCYCRIRVLVSTL